MGWMGIWWLFAAVVVVLLVWAVLRGTRGQAADGQESPEQVLKRRYAKGEIDRDTYLQMLKDLKGGAS